MQLQITEGGLYNRWLGFAGNRGIVECDFSQLNETPVVELLGDFATQRLTSFGVHASGSIISFYAKEQGLNVDEVSVAWLDSEGSPCIVVSKNLKEFLSLLPYGMGFIYTVAAAIENNLGDTDILIKVRERVTKNSDELLAEAAARFIDHQDLLNWLAANDISINKEPILAIIEAHNANDDLTPWLAENLI